MGAGSQLNARTPCGYGCWSAATTWEDTTGSAREATRLHERLTKVQAEFKRVRATQRELEQQVFFLEGVADDAETRRLVAETPLADREWQAAKTDLERHRKLLEESRTKAESLAMKRDELLDRLLDVEGTT